MNRKKLTGIVYPVLLYGLSFLFLAFLSYSTSPFTACDNGLDSAFFRLVGQGMTKGLLPYRDFFDMKGPLLFFIEYLGQRIAYGRLGIFLLQTLNYFLVLLLICALFRLYGITKRLHQLVLLLPVFLITGFTFEGGNLTEELSLVPLLGCLYLCLSYFSHAGDGRGFWQRHIYACAGAVFGVCFGFLLMIRVTNAALLAAMCLTVLLSLVLERKFRPLAVCIALFFVGLAVSVLPFLVYYAKKGMIGQMLEAVFVLGFRYSDEKSLLAHLRQMLTSMNKNLLLLVFIPFLIVLLLRWGKREERFLFFSGTLLTLYAISTGNNYPHYYTLTIPLVVLSEIAVAAALRQRRHRRAAAALLLAGLMLVSQHRIIQYYYHRGWASLVHPEEFSIAGPIRDVSAKIPPGDSVFCYGIDPYWYTYTDFFPCIRYCGWQNHYIALMPEIYDDLKSILETRPPRWLVLPAGETELPDFLEELLSSVYRQAYANAQYRLFSYAGQAESLSKEPRE